MINDRSTLIKEKYEALTSVSSSGSWRGNFQGAEEKLLKTPLKGQDLGEGIK